MIRPAGDDRFRAAMFEAALGRSGVAASPASIEVVMTVNGEDIPVGRPFEIQRGEPTVLVRPRQMRLDVDLPPSPLAEAPPVDDDLRERLVASIVQQAIGGIEYRDGFFEDEED